MQRKSLLSRSVCCYIIAALSLLSCASSKHSLDQTETHTADSASSTIINQGGVGQTTFNTDSIVSVIMAHISQQQTSSEQQQEHITESVTSYIDSLGREVRQEQRTIDRDITRQQELRFQQWQEQQEQRIASEYARIDSLYAMFHQSNASHHADSLSNHEATEPAQTLTWWQRFKIWLGERALYLFITLLIFLVVSYFQTPILSFLRKLLSK